MSLATPVRAPVTLPPVLKDNPRLDQWVRFETPGRVTVSTGRVEIGQGVLCCKSPPMSSAIDSPSAGFDPRLLL